MGRSNTRGKYDGLCLLMTVIAIAAFVLPSMYTFGGSIYVTLGGCATTGAFVVALFAAADLWLIMGNASLTKRWFTVGLVNFIPCSLFIVGSAYALMRVDSKGDVDVFFTVATQRLIALLLLGLIGCVFQYTSRWRLNGPLGDSSRRRLFQTSISDIMIVTAIIAALLGCLVYWFEKLNGPSRSRGSDEIPTLTSMIVGVEILIVVVYLLLPLVVSFGSPWIRRRSSAAVALWISFCGLVFASLTLFGSFGSTRRLGPSFVAAATVFVAHAAFAVVSLFVLWLLQRAGFGVLPHKLSTTNPSSLSLNSPSVRKRIAAVCFAMFLGTFAFYTYFDVCSLTETGSFSVSRRVAWMTRHTRSFPTGLFRWPGNTLKLLSATPEYQLSGTEDSLAKIIRTMVRPGVPSSVSVSSREAGSRGVRGDISATTLQPLQSVNVQSLTLFFDELDEVAFDDFCRTSNAKKVALHGQQLTPKHVQSLHQLRKLKDVSLHSVMQYTPALRQALGGLPYRSLSIQLTTDDVSVDALKNVNTLSISNSTLSASLVDQLDQIGLTRLHLVSCRFDDDALQRLAQMQLATLELVFPDEEAEPQPNQQSQLRWLQDSPGIQYLLADGRFDKIIETKFQNWRDGMKTTIEGINQYSPQLERDAFEDDSDVDTRSLYQVLLQEHAGDVNAVLERMATELTRDSDGRITELDLQAMPLQDVPFSKLAELQSTRRLRIGHPHQSRQIFGEISELTALQELEIAGYGIDNESLARICKLENLVRLQLPLSHYAVDPSACLHPEQIPIRTDVQTELLRELYRGLTDGYYFDGTYSDELLAPDVAPIRNVSIDGLGFAEISKLQNLEYIFMPGHLLREDTMDTIEQLPRLKQLHAVFSLVAPGLLKRIAAIQQLEQLSIGVRQVNANTLEQLGRLANLRVLQLALFDSNVERDAVKQGAILTQLRNTLPNCTVHVRFLSSLE